jgi:hypothetical protein
MTIVDETIAAQPRVGRQLLSMIRGLGTITDGFAGEWDQRSFDPAYCSEPLEHFEPIVLRVFARAKSI